MTIADRDAIYRKARDAYNRITVDGSRAGFGDIWTPEELVELRSAYETFQKLADAGYGKAYFPLYVFYMGGQGVHEERERSHYYAKMAFDWCYANQLQNDPEVWNDLGTLYRLGNCPELVIDSAQSMLHIVDESADLEMMQDGITLAGYHIEAGARSFTAYTRAMLNDLGEKARPYLRSWYEAVRHYPGFGTDGMSSPMKADAEALSDYVYAQAMFW